MNIIIDKLSEIDKAASRIIDSAAEKKSSMDQANEEKMKALDRKVEKENAEKIEAMRREFQESQDAELAGIRQQAQDIRREMEAYYEKNHDALSAKIVEDIIRK